MQNLKMSKIEAESRIVVTRAGRQGKWKDTGQRVQIVANRMSKSRDNVQHDDYP